jgi:5-methyltetrahydrofolate--homocysteine methyltransferase
LKIFGRFLLSTQYLSSLKESIINLRFDVVAKAAEEAMEAGIDPNKAINEGMVPGMVIVGEKFEKGEYFLSELVVAAEVMKEGLRVVTPYIKVKSACKLSKVVIATVEGDHHNLGKNIVTSLLWVQGFEVIDLGVDVATDKIVTAVKEHQPSILGMSALLTLTMPKMGEVIKALKTASMREKVMVIVGGTPITEEFAVSIGADHKAVNAVEGVKKCVEWVSSHKRRN